MPLTNATVVTNAGVAIQAKRMIGATPTQPEPKYIGMGNGASGGGGRTAAVGDTVLTAELAVTRATGAASTVTTTVTNDTYQCVGTVTAAATANVDEAGLFDALTAGNMLISATFTPVGLSAGDSIQFTFKNRFVAG